MVSRSDLPRQKADEALLVLFDLQGQEGALDWLEERAHWVRAMLNLKLGRRPIEAAAEPAAESAEDAVQNTISTLSAACEFYENPGHYRGQGKKPAAVMEDAGKRARDALNTVYGTAKNGGKADGGKVGGDDE